MRLVGLLDLAYFGVEFAVALRIGSVSLFADGIDFLQNASINFLIVGVLILLVDLDAAKEVYEAAPEEHRAAMP